MDDIGSKAFFDRVETTLARRKVALETRRRKLHRRFARETEVLMFEKAVRESGLPCEREKSRKGGADAVRAA